MDPFVGQIMPWPMNWAPRDWVICDGRMLQVSQYQALFALLGTNFGGDGRTTFGIPDLRGRVPIGYGVLQNPDKSVGENYTFATRAGKEYSTISSANLPVHAHTIPQTTATGNLKLDGATVTTNVGTPAYNNNPPATDLSDTPGTGKCITQGVTSLGGEALNMYTSNAPNMTLAKQAFTGSVTGTVNNASLSVPAGNTGNAGTGAPVDNRQPYIALNYIIATTGIFPPRT